MRTQIRHGQPCAGHPLSRFKTEIMDRRDKPGDDVLLLKKNLS
jgi:hypothetical protein